MRRRGAAALLAAAACGAGGGAAAASRPPTFAERQAVTAALPASVRTIPVGCVWLRVSVAAGGRWALVEPRFLDAMRRPCVRYASNGFFVLRRRAGWRVVYDGSEPPPCPLRVPRDLIRCRQ